jgi:hypothetical protein
MWQNDSGEAAIWEVNGTTVVAAASLGNPGPSWHVKGTGDFNGDSFCCARSPEATISATPGFHAFRHCHENIPCDLPYSPLKQS